MHSLKDVPTELPEGIVARGHHPPPRPLRRARLRRTPHPGRSATGGRRGHIQPAPKGPTPAPQAGPGDSRYQGQRGHARAQDARGRGRRGRAGQGRPRTPRPRRPAHRHPAGRRCSPPSGRARWPSPPGGTARFARPIREAMNHEPTEQAVLAERAMLRDARRGLPGSRWGARPSHEASVVRLRGIVVVPGRGARVPRRGRGRRPRGGREQAGAGSAGAGRRGRAGGDPGGEEVHR